MNKNRFIYICSPLKGDFKRNIDRAIKYSRFVYAEGFIPLAPHITFTQFLDNENSHERKAVIEMGLQLLTKCDELWSFGTKVSEGMADEIAVAKMLGIEIKKFNDNCKPLEVKDGNGDEE